MNQRSYADEDSGDLQEYSNEESYFSGDEGIPMR
jgi:hypothetical protein